MTSAAISRRQFLRGDLSGKRRAIRPPWARDEAAFAESCTRCGDCIVACPESILVLGAEGYPTVDFRRGDCSFCAECADRCTSGALRRPKGVTPPWTLRAEFGERCLNTRGVVCSSCAEYCEAGAIRIRPRVGGAGQPEIDPALCNGCGACYRPCPVEAIALNYRNEPVDSNQQNAVRASA